METKAFSELFPLFNPASSESLEWLLSIAEEQEYVPEEVILAEPAWGSAVCFIVSGWVKIQHSTKEKATTLEILGRGDSFGEMAILDEPLRSTEAIAMTDVQLLSVSAQRFIQFLFKDSQLHHRMLQLTVRRLRQLQIRYSFRHHLPAEKLVKTLVLLSEYGQSTEKGIEILNIPYEDLAAVADIDLEEVSRIMDKLQSKGWTEINDSDQTLCLTNLKQLIHLAGQI